MESPETDSLVVQAEPPTTWREALLARVRPSDDRVSDDEIFAILNEAGEGLTMAELCAAKGVTVPMYCVWKRKYRHLPLDQLRAARRAERRRRDAVIGVVLVTVAIVTGTIAVSAVRAVQSAIVVEAESASPVTPTPVESVQTHVSPPDRAEPGSAPTQPAAAPPARRSAANDVPAITETGYRIQVTAALNLQQGRTAVARLASAGYPAYLTTAVVDNSEVFRVRVGPFDTLAAAEEVASRLRAAGYNGVWIAR